MEQKTTDFSTLTPEQQFLKYGSLLSDLILATGTENNVTPVFTRCYEGNYMRHASLYRPRDYMEGKYGRDTPAPPISELIGKLHTVFRASATQMPELDVQALAPPTQALIAAFNTLLKEFENNATTHHRDASATYLTERKEIETRAKNLVALLKTSELETAQDIPVITSLPDGEVHHVRVSNCDNLGLLLFVLPHVSQSMLNENKVPAAIKKWYRETTGVEVEIVRKVIDSVYASDALQPHVAKSFTSLNTQLKKRFAEYKHVLQIAALVSSSHGDTYRFILNELGFETHAQRLENTLEAAIVLESIAEKHVSKRLDELIRQLSESKDNAPSQALLANMREALVAIAANDDATQEKLALLKNYIAAGQQVLVPETGRQNHLTQRGV